MWTGSAGRREFGRADRRRAQRLRSPRPPRPLPADWPAGGRHGKPCPSHRWKRWAPFSYLHTESR